MAENLAKQMNSLFDAEGRRRRKDRPVKSPRPRIRPDFVVDDFGPSSEYSAVEKHFRKLEAMGMHPLESIPFFDRPISASTRDLQVDEDDVGNPVFRTVLGEDYVIRVNPDQRTFKRKFHDDILPAIEAYFKDPTLPTKEQVVGAGKAVYEGIKETASIPGDVLTGKKSAGEVTMMDVADLSGMVSLGSIPFKVPEGAVRIFGGASAKKLDIKNFAKAEKLYEDGLDPESIRKETGWFKDDVDRKWRFEIDDSELKLTGEDYPGVDFSDSSGPDAWYNGIEEIGEVRLDTFTIGDYSAILKLGDFLQHPKLYKHYPQLKDYTIEVGAELDRNTLGTFDSYHKEIKLSGQIQDIDELKDVLVHEVQHAVQDIEGFLPGSNQIESAYLAYEKFKGEAKDVIKKLESYGYKIPTILDDTKPYKDNMAAALDNPSGTFYSFSQQKPKLTEAQKYSADKYLKRFEDLTKRISDVEAHNYHYYRNRSGEIEANLVEKRRGFTEEQRKLYSPISGKQGQITRPQAYRVADSVVQARQGQSDILLDTVNFDYVPSKDNPSRYVYQYKNKQSSSYSELYDEAIRDFLKGNKETKKLAGLKTGDTVTLNSTGQEYVFVEFRPYAELIRKLDTNYPHVFHEAMGETLEHDKVAGVTLVRIPRGTTFKKQRKELINFIKEQAQGNRPKNPFGDDIIIKYKEFSLGDLMFNSNKSTAKPEATASFRDTSDTDSGLLNKIGFSGGGLVREQ